MQTRFMTETSLLAALIAVSGAVKIPGIFPGTEFQLSAPLAVAICRAFGFRCYITAGVIASLTGLLLGTQTILQVSIAMIFRLTVGAILSICKTGWLPVVLAGPIGSITARALLGGLLGKGVVALIIAAIPGMVYTAIAAWPLTLLLRRIRVQTEEVQVNVIQR